MHLRWWRDKAKWWVVASRPFALPIFFALPIAGYALQYSSTSFDVILIGLGTMLMGVFAHLYNDYDDYKRGIDKIEGGSNPKAYTSAAMVLPSGKLSEKSVLYGALLSFILALLVGLYVFLDGHWYIIVPGAFGIFFTLSYNALGFKYRGLGGVSFAGALITGVLIGAMMNGFIVNWIIILISVFMAYAGFVLLNVDAYYDIEEDSKNGLKTFPMLHRKGFMAMAIGTIPLSVVIALLAIAIWNVEAWVSTVTALMLAAIGLSLEKCLDEQGYMVLVVGLVFILLVFLSIFWAI